MKKIHLIIPLLLFPFYSHSKGIEITKEKFVASFCKYIDSPEVNTETPLCPLKFKMNDDDDASWGTQTGYNATFPNGMKISIGVDKKTNKVTAINFSHSNNEIQSNQNDIIQIRYALINAVDNDLSKKHDDSFYNLISASKAFRGGSMTPVQFNELTHNSIKFTYSYDPSDEEYSFQANNNF